MHEREQEALNSETITQITTYGALIFFSPICLKNMQHQLTSNFTEFVLNHYTCGGNHCYEQSGFVLCDK
jgi:hypothetical protein